MFDELKKLIEECEKKAFEYSKEYKETENVELCRKVNALFYHYYDAIDSLKKGLNGEF